MTTHQIHLQVKVVYGLADKRIEENINNGLINVLKLKAERVLQVQYFLKRKLSLQI